LWSVLTWIGSVESHAIPWGGCGAESLPGVRVPGWPWDSRVQDCQNLSRRFRLLGTEGLVGIAIAAIDMALWDALARSHGTSLVGLLGGITKSIPAYGPVGFDGPAISANAASEWAECGFKGVKAKIGPAAARDDRGR
jgi:L-alanine-DL-glutamate epimerase-like enolase superfamily enzyme